MNARGAGWPDPCGDYLVALVAVTLSDLRDQLYTGGHHDAAELIADLVDVASDYLDRRAA